MDEKQIKKKIEKKIDKWGSITFWALFLLPIMVPFILNGVIPITIGLYILLILSFINLVVFITFSTYVYDLVEERYDDFIKREKYWQKQTLKEKILDVRTLVWFISLPLAILDIFAIPLYPIPGIIIGIMFIGFWLLGPFILGRDR
jgi:hypothetical protein